MLRIRELRKTFKMTMRELGEKLSIAESTVSAYEMGRREPDVDTLIKIADTFGVTVDYLVGRTNNDKALLVQQLMLNEEFRPEVIRLAMECNKSLNMLGIAAVYGYISRLKESDEFKFAPKRR